MSSNLQTDLLDCLGLSTYQEGHPQWDQILDLGFFGHILAAFPEDYRQRYQAVYQPVGTFAKVDVRGIPADEQERKFGDENA